MGVTYQTVTLIAQVCQAWQNADRPIQVRYATRRLDLHKPLLDSIPSLSLPQLESREPCVNFFRRKLCCYWIRMMMTNNSTLRRNTPCRKSKSYAQFLTDRHTIPNQVL